MMGAGARHWVPCPGRMKGLRPPGNRSAPEGDGEDFAPLAGGGVVHPEDGAVFPLDEGGGEGVGVEVVGGGIEGEDLPAGAAVDLDFQLVEEFGVALPAPAKLDAAGGDGGGEIGPEDVEVRPRGFRSGEAEIAAHGIGEEGVLFQKGHEIEEPGQAAFRAGGDPGGKGGWGEYRKDEDATGAGLGLLGGGGAGGGPGAGGGQVGNEDVNQPAGIGHGIRGLGRCESQVSGITGEFIAEVFQPGGLVGDTGGIVVLAFHGLGLVLLGCLVVWAWFGLGWGGGLKKNRGGGAAAFDHGRGRNGEKGAENGGNGGFPRHGGAPGADGGSPV